MFSATELERYARQLVLPEVGIEGQERLRAARVLIVGAGGLGSPAALYLAAAGVGTIGILDSDAVELSNLHRQILHRSADVGHRKVDSAARSLTDLNPGVHVNAIGERLTSDRARVLLSGYDLVVDGSDNYLARYAINDACAALSLPWVYGSVERFAGQVSVFGLSDGPCYRCIFPEAPAPGATASCEEIGVLGAVPGVIGALQSTEALKIVLGVGQPLSGTMLQVDFLSGEWRTFTFAKRSDCPACGSAPAARLPDPAISGLADIEPRELATVLSGANGSAPIVIDVRESWEWNIAHIEGARWIPLDRLEAALPSLERDREMVVYCHHGTRSALAADWLRAHGVRARNLAGGIDRWSREVDTAVRRY